MSSRNASLSPELQLSLEQFYYREARLLDGRQYRQWLALCSPEIRYCLPARTNPLVDNRDQGQEQMLSVERELEDAESDGCPIREEGFVQLSLRVERAYKPNSWSENPPARTRRIIGNVEVIEIHGDRIEVVSNFHLFYSRPSSRNFIYAGQRRDTLLGVHEDHEDYRIAARVVVMDMARIEFPTLGLLF